MTIHHMMTEMIIMMMIMIMIITMMIMRMIMMAMMSMIIMLIKMMIMILIEIEMPIMMVVMNTMTATIPMSPDNFPIHTGRYALDKMYAHICSETGPSGIPTSEYISAYRNFKHFNDSCKVSVLKPFIMDTCVMRDSLIL